MEYREFGNTGLRLSGLGFGMNRFSPEMLEKEEGIEQAAALVIRAIKNGVNYIDVARNYSNRKAFPILRKVLQEVRTEDKVHICIKMMLNHTDKTKEGALKDIEEQLRDLHIEKADLCFAQAVKSYEEYQEVMKPGGIYEGFLEAKKRGLIDHICLSSHATVEETLQIMEDGMFEGYTISYHLLNCVQMQPVLDKAKELGVGILTMNSLAGGLIPQNPQLFQELHKNQEEICQLAIQYIYSDPAITSVLSGMQSAEELECNIAAIEHMEEFKPEYKTYFEKELYQKNELCTGCDYCKGCPKGIQIKSLMYSYNVLQWDNNRYAAQYQRQDEELLNDIRLTQEMMHHGIEFPMPAENPCIACRRCEKKCTQSLPIVERIQTIYQKLSGRITDRADWEKRLKDLKDSGYQSVAFYPNCATTRKLLEDYCVLFGQPEFKLYVIDRNEKLWGKISFSDTLEAEVVGLDKILEIHPDCVMITHYILQDILYDNVEQCLEHGIEVKKIYQTDDLPIVYLGG